MSEYILHPNNTKIKSLNIAVVDIEAPSFTENDKFYMAGFYDGYDYTPFYSLEELFEEILQEKYKRYKILAHFGGGYDFIFFADYFKRNNIHYSVISSGSRIIQINVIVPKDEDKEFHIMFWDSFSLMPSGLDKLGKLFLGKGKARIDISNYSELSRIKQIEYNKQDCILLYDIFKKFENQVNEIGGNVKVTLASTALDIFTHKYLLNNLVSDSKDYEFVQQSYKGGRVEIFRFDYSGHDYLYDFNSFYPWAMTFPLPTGHAQKIYAPEVKEALYYIYNFQSYFAVLQCKVRIKDCYIPPLPFSHNGKLLFPVGTFEGVFTNIELNLLYQYDLGEVLSVNCIYLWQLEPILKEYSFDLYNRRKNSNNETEKYILKLLLNSLYGKFGSSPYKEIVKFGIEQINNIEQCQELSVEQGVFLEKEYRYSQCTKVEIASCITAICRRRLFEMLLEQSKKGKIYYCDTDSLITETKCKTGDELGQLKLEAIIDKMQLILPKLYKVHLELGEEVIKAKGFRKINKAAYDHLIMDGKIDMRHFRKFREMVRKNEGPKTELRFKRLRSVYDKREIVGNDTRPIRIG